jgi:hypothetical protein
MKKLILITVLATILFAFLPKSKADDCQELKKENQELREKLSRMSQNVKVIIKIMEEYKIAEIQKDSLLQIKYHEIQVLQEKLNELPSDSFVAETKAELWRLASENRDLKNKNKKLEEEITVLKSK